MPLARAVSLAAALGSLVALPLAAHAQGADSPPAEGMEPAADPGVDDETSINDDPDKADAATLDDETPAEVKKKKPRATKATYPVELSKRPLTLTRNTTEISLDVPFVVGALDTTQVIRGAFGVTQDLQVGISYGVGFTDLDPPDGGKTFEPGKAFSIDAGYTLVPDVVAVTVSLPFYADPFAMSATIGAPFRWTLHEKLAIVGGQDLVEISFGKWPVRVGDPGFNLGQILGDQTNIPFSSGAINVQFGPVIQLKPHLALTATFRYHVEDFDSEQAVSSLFGGLVWSKWNLDLGGRIGFGALDLASDTFGIGLFAAYRL